MSSIKAEKRCHSPGVINAQIGQNIPKRCCDQLRQSFIKEDKLSACQEQSLRKIRPMESYDIKMKCLFCGQDDRSGRSEKEHELPIILC